VTLRSAIEELLYHLGARIGIDDDLHSHFRTVISRLNPSGISSANSAINVLPK
jgi:hypothetical protein